MLKIAKHKTQRNLTIPDVATTELQHAGRPKPEGRDSSCRHFAGLFPCRSINISTLITSAEKKSRSRSRSSKIPDSEVETKIHFSTHLHSPLSDAPSPLFAQVGDAVDILQMRSASLETSKAGGEWMRVYPPSNVGKWTGWSPGTRVSSTNRGLPTSRCIFRDYPHETSNTT